MRKFRMLTATALIGAMVFGVTACGQPKPTTVTTEPTTTVTETETTPSESETTPSETTVETTKESPFTPEQALGLTPDAGLTEINLGDATLKTQEFDGVEVPMAPNYTAGKDIVITFKSDAEMTITRAFKYSPDIGISINEAIPMWEVSDGKDITFDMSKIVSNVTLTNADGVYTLTIPAECVTSNYFFYIELNNSVVLNLRCVA